MAACSTIQKLSICVAILIGFFATVADSQSGLRVGFYDRSCPNAELIIRRIVQDEISRKPGIGAGLLRLHFHDCFVRGCDASVLLDSTKNNSAEKDAPPNISLRGFQVVDRIKAALEAQCPGRISCADVLAFAARDSVFTLGGPFWQVPAGRRDGTVSHKKEAVANLPAPIFNVSQLTANFAAQGLSQDDMITLSGAHTIGIAHCFTFSPRVHNFSANHSVDPSLDPNFAMTLKSLCPVPGPPGSLATPGANKSVVLDTLTPIKFDNSYFVNLGLRKGLLTSDQVLFTDPSTASTVKTHAVDENTWKTKFVQSMIRMGSNAVKTGFQGEIRKQCRFVN